MLRNLWRRVPLFRPHTGRRGYGRRASDETSTPEQRAGVAGQLTGYAGPLGYAGELLARLDYIRPTPRAIAAARYWLRTFPDQLDRIHPAELRRLVREAWDHAAVLDAGLRAWEFAALDDTYVGDVDYLAVLRGAER